MARVKTGEGSWLECDDVEIGDAVERVVAAGFGGLAVWVWGEEWCACLLDKETCERLPETNLWHWQRSATDALAAVVHVAERAARKEQDPAEQAERRAIATAAVQIVAGVRPPPWKRPL